MKESLLSTEHLFIVSTSEAFSENQPATCPGQQPPAFEKLSVSL